MMSMPTQGSCILMNMVYLKHYIQLTSLPCFYRSSQPSYVRLHVFILRDVRYEFFLSLNAKFCKEKACRVEKKMPEPDLTEILHLKKLE